MRNNAYHIHISADKSPMSLNLREVWNYRDLIELYTRRSFTLTYKQTILGPAWIIVNPLVTSVVYTFIFGNLAGLSTEGTPQVLFYLCSNAFWGFFAACLTSNSATFNAYAHIFKKAYFPRLTIPISNTLSAGINLLIRLAMAAVFIVYYLLRGTLHPNWILLPLLAPVAVVAGILGLSIGILISSVTTKYRDLQFLVGFGLQLLMFATPVVYPLSQLAGKSWRVLLELNPMTAPMEIFRLSVLGVGTISWLSILSTILCVVVLAPLSVLVFNKVERTFIDTV